MECTQRYLIYMSHVIGKERCPECAKTGKDTRGNNLAIYSDGHRYCFSCGYYQHGDIKYIIHEKLERVDNTPSNLPTLPEDVVMCTYGPGYEWLRKYEITTHEIMQNKILWSESKQWLIFPYYEGYTVSGFQARNFNKDKPYKYFTAGNIKDLLWIFGKNEPLVLVEDLVSAIKVGRHTSCMPILGSVINLKLLMRLTKITSSLVIWLDPDKQKEMIKFSSLATMLGFKVKTIFSDKDPKDYDNARIKCYLQSW